MIKECMEKHGNMKLMKHWKRDHVSCQLCHMPPHTLFAYAWMLPFELFQQQWLMNSYHSTQLSLASTPSNKILRPKRAPTSVKHVMAPCAAKHFARRVSIQLCIHFAGTSLSFVVTYHLHISKYIMVRDSVRQGSKFGPESIPNPEKQYWDPFVKMCSMGEHISNPSYHWRTRKLGKADSGHLAFKAWEHAGKSSLFSIVTTTSRLLIALKTNRLRIKATYSLIRIWRFSHCRFIVLFLTLSFQVLAMCKTLQNIAKQGLVLHEP